MRGENILSGCLVESDPAVVSRERRAKRRALIAAIILQVLLVGLLVLAPLLGAVEKLPTLLVMVTPTPPYKGEPKQTEPKHEKQQGPRKALVTSNKPPIYQPPSIPTGVADIQDPPEAFDAQAAQEPSSGAIGDPNGILDLNAPSGRNVTLKPPEQVAPKPKGPVLVPPTVQEARLVNRVEPKYPPLPKSAGIEGKIVLRAVIAKDDTIQSLEVMSGNPLFAEAAQEAILQWRYQPTLLHGEPVEVETVITVFFTLRR